MAAEAVFVWRGRDGGGTDQSGEVAAPSLRFARAQLRRQGIAVQRLRRKRVRPSLRRGVAAKDIALFSRQMATMMRAGLPVVQAFDIVASGAKGPRYVALVRAVRDDVATGAPLAEALGRHPEAFDRLYRALVAVGEHTGTLETMLARIAVYQETAAATRRKLRKAMTYPLLVVFAAVAVAGVLLTQVVPQFQTVFAAAGSELPALTRAVIRASDLVQAWWWVLLLAPLAVAVAAAVAQRRSRRWRRLGHRLALKLPVLGAVLANAAVARFARTLATALGAGVPLVEALASVTAAVGNLVYMEALDGVRAAVAEGLPLHSALSGRGLFPNVVVQMVAVGEEAGRLEEMLGRAADQFETLVDETVDNLATLLEPLLLAVLGVLVGGLVLAMYLPVFQLGQAFG